LSGYDHPVFLICQVKLPDGELLRGGCFLLLLEEESDGWMGVGEVRRHRRGRNSGIQFSI